MKLLRRTNAILSILLVSTLFVLGTALAQTPTGSISGTVTDSSGAVVAGAKITVIDRDKGTSQVTTSDSAGRYRVGGLIPDHYDVQTQMEGFRTEIRQGIQMTVGNDVVINLSLQVGQVAQSTTVTAAAPLVETVSGTVSSLVDDRAIRQLPLNGRSFDQLIALNSDAPQYHYRSAGTPNNVASGGSANAYTVNGGRPGTNAFIMDGTEMVGASANSTLPGGALGINMGVDAILEFSVLTSNYSAAYGKRGGGAINIATRSGTNQIHGSAFEFLRNSALDARSFFDSVKPSFRRNDFGGSIGGPIKKDSTFFFGNYEGLRQSLGQTVQAIVPNAAARQGFVPSGGSLVNIGVAPSVQPYLNLYPAANGRDFGDGTATAQNSITNVGSQDYFLLRGDRKLSDRDAMFGRYNFSNSSFLNPDPTLTSVTVLPARDQAATVQETRTYASFLNQFRLGFTRSRLLETGNVTNGSASSLAFLPGAPSMGAISFGTPSQAGIPPLNPIGGLSKWGGRYVVNQFEVGDQAYKYLGAHSLQFGVNVQDIQHNDNNATTKLGSFQFASLQTFLQGKPSSFQGPQITATSGDGSQSWRQKYFATFIQDDFKVLHNLTLNLGARWEFMTAPREVHNRVSNYIPQTVNGIALLPTTPTVGGSVFHTNFGTASPRVGFAWDTFGDGKMAVRGGFGIFYNQIEKEATSNLLNAPFFGLQQLNNAPFPIGFSGGGTVKSALPSPNVFDPNADTATKLDWNLGVERQITTDTVLKLGYVGSHSYHLIRQTDLNGAVPQILSNGTVYYAPNSPARNPLLSSSRYREADASSSYNAFKADLVARESHGLRYKFSYTFAKCIDSASGIANSDTANSASTSQNPFDLAAERGRCAFDIRNNAAANFSYDVTAKSLNGVSRKLFDGWEISSIISASSGNSFEVIDGFSQSGDGQRTTADRPNLLPGKSNNPILGHLNQWFDPTAFALAAPGFYGNLGRNTLTAPGFFNMDFSLVRSFPVTERLKFDFRAEIFNLLNHPSFGVPALNVFNPNGSVLGSAGAILAPTTTSPREIQFGLKLIF